MTDPGASLWLWEAKAGNSKLWDLSRLFAETLVKEKRC